MLCVTGVGGQGTKPVGKGVDMDAVGNINGVPVYEFDLDGLKVEDKPWRKPGMQCFCATYLTVCGGYSMLLEIFVLFSCVLYVSKVKVHLFCCC